MFRGHSGLYSRLGNTELGNVVCRASGAGLFVSQTDSVSLRSFHKGGGRGSRGGQILLVLDPCTLTNVHSKSSLCVEYKPGC